MDVALEVHHRCAEPLLHEHQTEELLRCGGLGEGEAGGEAGVVVGRGFGFLKGFRAGLGTPNVLHPANVGRVKDKVHRLPFGADLLPLGYRLLVETIPLGIGVNLPAAEAVETSHLLHRQFLLRVSEPHPVGADGEAQPRLRDETAAVEELGMFRRFPSRDDEQVVAAVFGEGDRLGAGFLRHQRSVWVRIVKAVRASHSASVGYLEKHICLPFLNDDGYDRQCARGIDEAHRQPVCE